MSTSASSSTSIGSLPPSSSTTGSSLRAAASPTRLPVATLPVNMSLSMGDSISAAPASPSPTITCMRSGFNPAAINSRCNSRAISGVNSDGFSTTALPVTNAASVSTAGIEKG